MKIPKKKKKELQQIVFNHLLDFMNLFKKFTAKPYSFLVIDATLASDNDLRFRKNLLERIENLIMAIYDKMREKLKNCNTILTEKLRKYQHYHLEKLINMNILQVKIYYLPIEEK